MGNQHHLHLAAAAPPTTTRRTRGTCRLQVTIPLPRTMMTTTTMMMLIFFFLDLEMSLHTQNHCHVANAFSFKGATPVTWNKRRSSPSSSSSPSTSTSSRSSASAATTLHGAASTTTSLLPDTVFDTINQGGIAVVDDFLSPKEVSRLRNDARTLFSQGEFITDSLAGYGNSNSKQSTMARDKSQFDPSKDRSVLPAYIPSKQRLGPFVSPTLGDADVRRDFTKRTIAALRRDVSIGLDRPGMDVLPDGINNHEISYTRFGPGAYLKRHNDEHHEELKGVHGWSKPTRRSLSWLIYLNEPDWDASTDGGFLRTYPRISKPSSNVGSRNGDLQIGWLRPTQSDPVERPVFLDGRRSGEAGNCALYIDPPNNNNENDYSRRRLYLTKDFKADPYLFVSTDWVVQHVLVENSELGSRFHYVEPPKSLLSSYWERQHTGSSWDVGESVLDVPPTGGTLVMFDSVTLPHEVMSTLQRERWATSGWFHEVQQEIPSQRQQLFVS